VCIGIGQFILFHVFQLRQHFLAADGEHGPAIGASQLHSKLLFYGKIWLSTISPSILPYRQERDCHRKFFLLAKSVSDAAWNQLITYTTYKAENAGRVVVLVDPRNTSKMCSYCGAMVEKSLSVRVHACPVCGLVMDRDENAANNILRLGLESLGVALEAPAFRRGE
jgi:predicted RNA-binding Zn-ribbon protein involved in translation (DUF1610 family)